MKTPLLPADLLLALRYLRPKRTFVSVITLLSILGPILGVAVLVVVTAVMSGFDRDLRESFLSLRAHLQVFPGAPADERRQPFLEDPLPVVQALEAAGMKAAPVIEGPAIFQRRARVQSQAKPVPGIVKGIDPKLERNVSGVAQKLLAGTFDIGDGEAVIGNLLAADLGVGIGDKILIHSPGRFAKNVEWDDQGKLTVKKSDEAYLPEEVTVAGVFSIGVYEFDSGIVYVAQDKAADLFAMPWGSASYVQAKSPNPLQMDGTAQALQRQFPDLRFMTWKDANKQFFDTLRVEKFMMFFLMFFIVLVSAFGITGTLITAVVQKTKEIGILKAVGMPWTSIFRIFLYQGAVIGVVGTTVGTGLGLLIVHYRNAVAWFLGNSLGVEIFPAKLYHLTRIPGHLLWSDVAIIVGGSLALCITAAIIPALFAAALSPADALREEN
jgi:lipoprotein-releasing system permease protein